MYSSQFFSIYLQIETELVQNRFNCIVVEQRLALVWDPGFTWKKEATLPNKISKTENKENKECLQFIRVRIKNFKNKSTTSQEFPGGPVVRTQHFHCPGLGSIPGWGTKIPQAAWQSQKKKKKQSITSRMDKEDVVYIYNGILLSHKKERNNAICSNMDGPRDCHTE